MGPVPEQEQGLLGQVGSFLGQAAEGFATAPLADVIPVIGDARAVWRGLTEQMGPLERTLSLLPLAAVGVGAGALGRSFIKARGATRSAAEMLAASQQRNLSMAPMDQPYTARAPQPDTSLPPSQASAYAYAQRYSNTGQGPYARALGAETYEQLAAHLTGTAPERVPLHLIADLPHVGASLVRNSPRPYAGATTAEQAMNAARSAMARMEVVVESEVMDPMFKRLWDAWKTDNISEADRQLVTTALINVEEGLRDVFGPDMVGAPYVALAGFMTDTANPTPVISVSAAAVNNPRVLDPETGFVPDPAGLSKAFERIDPMSIVGEMAGNEINAVKNLATPVQAEKFGTWWKRFHDLSREVSEQTGIPVEQVSAAFAALSPATRWTPDNILGGIHMAIQYARADLTPGSPQYVELVEQILRKTGWWDEVIEDRGFRPHMMKADFSRQISGRGGPKGGLTLTNKNLLKAAELVKGVPWQELMTALKTKKMAMLGANPLLPTDVVIDRHDFDLLMGFWSTLDKTPQFENKRYYEAMEQAHILAADVLGHREASTGQAIGWAVVKEGKEELGLGTQRIGKNRAVYNEGISRLIEQADPLAPNPVSMTERVSNQVGSFPPPPPRLRRSLEGNQAPVKRLLSATRTEVGEDLVSELMTGVGDFYPEGQRSIRDVGVQEPIVLRWGKTKPYVADGNHRLEAAARLGLKQIPFRVEGEDSDKVLSWLVPGFRGGNKYDHDHTVLLVPQPDGSVRAYAPPETPGLEDKFRHLYVSPITDGRVHQLMPRQPAAVLDMDDVRRPYAQSPEEIRSMVPIGGNTHPALERGTVVYVEIDSPDGVGVIEEAIGPYGVYDIAQNPVSVTQGGVPKRNLSIEDLEQISDLEGPGSPMLQNDWVILTSQKSDLSTGENWDRLKDLMARIRKMGYQYHNTDGSYGGEQEMSLTIFGMSYKDAVALGKRYDQESVATAAGLIYTTGPNAGKMHPAASGHLFGVDAVDTENYSIIGVGKRDLAVAWQYDWDELSDIDNIETLAPSTQQAGGGKVGVSIKMGHAAAWTDVNKITKALKPHVQSTSAYVTGRNLVPDGYVEAYETLYRGTNGEILSVRTKTNPGMNNPNVYKVYVTPDAWLKLGDGIPSTGPSVRDIDGSRSVVDGQTMVTYLGEAGPGADIRIKGTNQLKGSIDGKKIKAALITPGAVHVLGERPGVAPPMGVGATISNGKVTRLEGDPSAIDDAVRTLRRLGAEVPEDVVSDGLRLDEGTFVGEIVAAWWGLSGRVPQPMFKDPVTGVKRQRPFPGSQARSATLGEMLGVEVLVNLPPSFSDKQITDIFASLKRLADDGWPADLYSKESLPGGISSFLPVKPLTMGATPSQGPMMMKLSEHYALAEQSNPEIWRKIEPPGKTIRQNAGITGEHSIFATVAIHESGHLLITRMNELGLRRAFRNRMGQALDELGGILGVEENVSSYATNGWEEFFSEALVQYTYQRSSAHPAIVSLMEDAQKLLKGDEDYQRRWGLEYLGAGDKPSISETPTDFWKVIG